MHTFRRGRRVVRAVTSGLLSFLFAGGLAVAALPADTIHAALPDRTAYSWGYSVNGDLGTGLASGQQLTPTALPSLGGVTSAVSAGATHGLALVQGTVYAWGDNEYGQVGSTPASPYYFTTPQAVAGLTTVRMIAAGGAHSLALKDDGTVWAWGNNNAGQLGQSITTKCSTAYGIGACSQVPQQVLMNSGAALSSITAIAAAGNFSLALRNDGTVWAWGANEYGQLGDGTASLYSTSSSRAVQVTVTGGMPLTAVTAIAAGGAHALALQAPASTGALAKVFAWGDPIGVLGLYRPPCAQAYSPAPCVDRAQMVLSVAGLSAIGAGSDSSFGVANGQVWAWGWNLSGELGDGTTTNRTSPVLLSGISGVQGVAGGVDHTLALMNDGTVRGWGDPGAVGVNCPNNVCASPVQVPGLDNIFGVSAGMAFNVAVTRANLYTICVTCLSQPILPPKTPLPPRP